MINIIHLEFEKNTDRISVDHILKIFENSKQLFVDTYHAERKPDAPIQEYIARLYNEGAEMFDQEQHSDRLLQAYASFLVPILKEYNVKSVLDCACGTGAQTVSLAIEGYNITGSDISTGMLQKAKEKAIQYHVNVRLLESDFCQLEKSMDERYDAVICMTNSLSHLISEREIKRACDSIYHRLNSNGVALIELLNYDELLKTKPKWIPVKIAEQRMENLVTMLYVFDYLQENIIRWYVIYFKQAISTGESSMDVNIFDSMGIQEKLLKEIMLEVGFKHINRRKSLVSSSQLFIGER